MVETTANQPRFMRVHSLLINWFLRFRGAENQKNKKAPIPQKRGIGGSSERAKVSYVG